IIIFLELSKIEKLLKKPVAELTDIECWLLFFKYAADKSKREMLNKIIEKEEGVNMATQILMTVSKEERERALEFSQLIYELDQRSERESAILGAKREVAKKMKLISIPLDSISEVTGLSLEEVMAL
ncbi:MAG: Rpn family recombination-promoting nuclease/putative transposase, partial [Defluviitaleaceae bacterium]|nr:Rpn family recombination-promoting nuclease/putative transposase [Defluviitaleaceae bacterium]